ncbi:MAG: sterol desaturase family protein [Alphaproteobacteria bacterium]|nr:sterol desaturase family protein [Alphaproteobacteria bacterium]
MDQQHLQAFLLSVVRLSVWLLLLAVVFLPLERLLAVRPRKIFSKGLASDIGFYFISGLVPAVLLTPPLTLVALGVQAIIPPGLHATVAGLPLWARIAGALVVSEIGFYWGHRWAHEIPLLWRFHSIHHHPTEVYFLVSARAHPVDNVFIRLCGLIPVYILGLATPLTPSGGAVSALLVLLFIVWGFLIHANVRWRLGPLEWLISTPGFHHWHHTLPEPRDRNYASMLPCMDWLFGTLHLPHNEWPSAYGIDTKLPDSLAGQLLHPFRAQPSRVAAPESATADP